jgi:hypothetical protein
MVAATGSTPSGLVELTADSVIEPEMDSEVPGDADLREGP